MVLRFSVRNLLLVIAAALLLSACATKTTTKVATQIAGDVFTGEETVKYLATGVPDRVFFAYDSYSVTTRGLVTLQKQAKWMEENSSFTIIVQGHCDERGTREYNLALGERRANAAKDYLMTYGVSANRISVISYGKERPVDSGSNPLSWSKNRRSVTVKAN